MKNIILIIILALSGGILSAQSNITITFPDYYKLNVVPHQENGVVVWCKEFNIITNSVIGPIPNKTRKKMNAAQSLKALRLPVILEYDEACYQIDLKRDHKKFRLFWDDLNNDGKLNPMKEIKYADAFKNNDAKPMLIAQKHDCSKN